MQRDSLNAHCLSGLLLISLRIKQQAWPLSECENAPCVIDEFSAAGVKMFGHPDTFLLTFHVLRLRDSGAQTQGEGEEKQSHLFSLSENSSHFQGYGDGVKEKKKKISRRDGEKKRKVLPSLRARRTAECAPGLLFGVRPLW